MCTSGQKMMNKASKTITIQERTRQSVEKNTTGSILQVGVSMVEGVVFGVSLPAQQAVSYINDRICCCLGHKISIRDNNKGLPVARHLNKPDHSVCDL